MLFVSLGLALLVCVVVLVAYVDVDFCLFGFDLLCLLVWVC